MTEEKATININIHGGNNQILPNATHAEQHFHYHNTEAAYQPSRTRIYNNVYANKKGVRVNMSSVKHLELISLRLQESETCRESEIQFVYRFQRIVECDDRPVACVAVYVPHDIIG